MKHSLKNISAVTLALVTAFGLVQTPVYAEENNKETARQTEDTKSEASKEETVYVITDASGKKQNVIVSDWLKNATASDKLTDFSSLFDIENIEGNQTFQKNADGSLTWNANGKDIYYQGTTEKELPVNVKVSYQLDGKKIDGEELAGKAGHVVIRFDYENNAKTEVEVNGKQEEITVPFAMISGLKLDQSRFSNIEVTNGKVISEGKNTFVVGMAFPGLKDSLKLKEDSKIDLPEYVEIEADVTDFALDMTMTMASNNLLSELNGDGIDTSEITDGLDQLTDATSQLVDGSSSLKEGTEKLRNGASDLADGASALKDGTQSLADGSLTLANGSSTLANGASQLQEGAAKLQDGVNTLGTNTEALAQGLVKFDQALESQANAVQKEQLANMATALNYTNQLNNLMKGYASIDMENMKLDIDENTMLLLAKYGVIDEKGFIQEDTIAKLKQLPGLLGHLKASGLVDDNGNLNSVTKQTLTNLGLMDEKGNIDFNKAASLNQNLPELTKQLKTLQGLGILDENGALTKETAELLTKNGILKDGTVNPAKIAEMKRMIGALQSAGIVDAYGNVNQDVKNMLTNLPSLMHDLNGLVASGYVNPDGSLSAETIGMLKQIGAYDEQTGTINAAKVKEVENFVKNNTSAIDMAELANTVQLLKDAKILTEDGLNKAQLDLLTSEDTQKKVASLMELMKNPEAFQAAMKDENTRALLGALKDAGLLDQNGQLNEEKLGEFNKLKSMNDLLNQLIASGVVVQKDGKYEIIETVEKSKVLIAQLQSGLETAKKTVAEQQQTIAEKDAEIAGLKAQLAALQPAADNQQTQPTVNAESYAETSTANTESYAEANTDNTVVTPADEQTSQPAEITEPAEEVDVEVSDVPAETETPVEETVETPVVDEAAPVMEDTELVSTTEDVVDPVAYYTSLSTNDVTKFVVESAKNSTNISEIEAFMKAYTDAITQAAGETGAAQAINAIRSNPDYQRLIAGAQALSNAVNGDLKNGVDSLASGSWQLKDGSETLSNGAWALNEGAAKLNNGAGELLDGVLTLKDGTIELDDGAKQLMEGMQKFEEEGINKLVDELGGELGDTLDRLEAVIDAGKAYQSFSGANDGEADGVKFIFKTSGIN